MESKHAQAVKTFLLGAGWRPGHFDEEFVDNFARVIQEHDDLPMPESARRALLEYGGLESTYRGPGLECARESFSLTPDLAAGECDRLERVGSLLGHELYPIGVWGDGMGLLAVDGKGSIYETMEGDYLWIGDDIETALATLLLGLRRENR